MYIFSCTSSDAQKYLTPWFNTKESDDLFGLAKEMLKYLSTMYEDLYKV